MQPQEPNWDRSIAASPRFWGCLAVAVAALLVGVSLWFVQARGRGLLDEITERLGSAARDEVASAPSPSPSPAAEVAVAAPTPEATPQLIDFYGEEDARRSVEEMSEEMRRKLEAMKGSIEAGADPLRVGGEVTPPEIVSRVEPKYTEVARRARITGVVILEAVIDRRGSVVGTRVLKGLPMGLDQAAIDAVSQWKFRPATLGGNPVAVYFTVTVNFRLK
jgi:protein TonB